MMENSITLPSKPRVVSEEGAEGTFEIDGLYPGYGHTLGNSLRRIILSLCPARLLPRLKSTASLTNFQPSTALKRTS